MQRKLFSVVALNFIRVFLVTRVTIGFTLAIEVNLMKLFKRGTVIIILITSFKFLMEGVN